MDVSSSAASGDDDDENDEYIESPASSYNRNSLTVPVNNTNSTNNNAGTNVFRKYRVNFEKSLNIYEKVKKFENFGFRNGLCGKSWRATGIPISKSPSPTTSKAFC